MCRGQKLHVHLTSLHDVYVTRVVSAAGNPSDLSFSRITPDPISPRSLRVHRSCCAGDVHRQAGGEPKHLAGRARSRRKRTCHRARGPTDGDAAAVKRWARSLGAYP